MEKSGNLRKKGKLGNLNRRFNLMISVATKMPYREVKEKSIHKFDDLT